MSTTGHRPRPWGRGSWVAGLMLLAVGCQPMGPERPSTPEPRERPPVRTLPGEVPGADRPGPPGPGYLRTLPAPEVPLDGIDVILHAPLSRDPHLQERTRYWVAFWTARSRDHFGRYLQRMGIYQDMVDRELAERGLPASLRYLPIVESGYHHSIRSRVGATGLWQLMGPTARDLGLTVDGIVDDRRDPVGSTDAALDYLTHLYLQFDSWFLALSAYNAGPGRVARILQRYAPDPAIPGDERYLVIRQHLPAETREFVPRFFAAAYLAMNAEEYGFAPPNPTDALAFDEVLVPDATSLDVIAAAAEVDEDEIVQLNPHFMRGFTPPGQERRVRLPTGRADAFEANYALIPPEERISFMEHVVARGETLGHIARRYGVSVAELDGANGGLDPRRLQIGQRLIVPVGGGGRGATRVAGSTSPSTAAGSGDDAGNGASRHVVSSGENLWTIARRHGTSVNELRRWNGLSEGAVLQPGQELHVGEGARLHTVRSGETWSGIAGRYGVSTAELARVNGRSISDVIRVGEELRIP